MSKQKELSEVKIYDIAGFAQPFGVPARSDPMPVWDLPPPAPRIRARGRRVGASAATPSPYQPPHVIIQAPRGQK